MELIRLNKTNLHRISELNRLFFLFCCTHDNAPSGEIAGETEERNKELGAILFDAQEAFINANWHKCCSIVTDTTTCLHKEDVDYSMIPLKDMSQEEKKESIDKKYHLWTIKDAKPGDVLANGNHILILKELDYDWYTNGTPYSVHAYCGIKPNGNFELGKEHWCFCGTLHMRPATSEERDLLFKKVKEAGYEWDADKKELKKIK